MDAGALELCGVRCEQLTHDTSIDDKYNARRLLGQDGEDARQDKSTADTHAHLFPPQTGRPSPHLIDSPGLSRMHALESQDVCTSGMFNTSM